MLDTMGDRLQYARKQKNLTQQKVCDSVDIEKVQTLSAYERDKNNPPIPILEKLCNLYQVSVDWIIRGKEFEKTITTNAELIETLLDCAKRLGLDMGWERDYDDTYTGRCAIWLENDTLVGFNKLMQDIIELRNVQKMLDIDDYRAIVHKRIQTYAIESDDFAQLPDDDEGELPF